MKQSLCGDHPLLVVPGFQNSDPGHWQSIFEERFSGVRVQQRDWFNPVLADWVAELAAAIARETTKSGGRPVVLLAHSLGCIAIGHWASHAPESARRLVRAAVLVAPPDIEREDMPAELFGFRPFPSSPLPFPSLVIASSSDPYGALERARVSAEAWGSRFLAAQAPGHINIASGHGEWAEGEQAVREFLSGL